MLRTTELPRLTLNTLTGGPLLRLLLAVRGEEPPDMNPMIAWEVFRQFAALPADSGHNLVSFQATSTPEDTIDDPDPPLFYVTWSRELLDRSDLGPISRAVQLQWSLEIDASAPEDVELWSDAYPNLDEFFKHVESLPQFTALMQSPAVVDLYSVELDV